MIGYLRRLRRQAEEDYYQSVRQLATPIPGGVLLDCGSEDGSFSLSVGRAVGAERIEGIDVDPENIAKSTERGIHTHAADLNAPLSIMESNYFDGIVACQVIEHLWNTDNFLSELFRILKPGGWAVICTENLASWHNIFALVLGYTPFSLAYVSCFSPSIGNPLSLHHEDYDWADAKLVPLQHIRVFTFAGLKHLARLHGFEVERAVGVGYFPLPVWTWRVLNKLDARHSPFITLRLVKPA